MGKHIKWIQRQNSGKSGAPSWVREIINGVPEGVRHDSAVRLVGRWYGKGLCQVEVSMILVIWNQLNLPPLSLQELESIDNSTTKWERPQGTFFMSNAEARETYLIPLRDIISRWSVELIRFPGLSTSLNRLIQSTSDVSAITESQIYKDSIEFNKNMLSMAQEHEEFMGQISDKKLQALIIETLKIQGEALARRIEIFEDIVIDKDFGSLAAAIDESNKILIEVQDNLINVNKRIEELLCGDESE